MRGEQPLLATVLFCLFSVSSVMVSAAPDKRGSEPTKCTDDNDCASTCDKPLNSCNTIAVDGVAQGYCTCPTS